jgi:hypothetical protein
MTSNLKRIAAFAAASVLASISAVGANDGYAALGAGGIVLMNSDDIRMASEDLFISEKVIRVKYVFINDSPAPITARVAFPMPKDELFESGGIAGYRMMSKGDGAPLGFTVFVDGMEIEPEVERKAFHDGKDVTQTLNELGVPILYPSPELAAAIAALPTSTRDALISRNLASATPQPDGTVSYDFYWTVQHIYHWEQTFPAGRPLRVEHEYQPATGASYDIFYEPITDASDLRGLFSEEGAYCIDEWIAKGIARRVNASLAEMPADATDEDWPGYHVGISYIDYVLSTATTWKGPIGRFKLTVDKGRSQNIVSMCMGGFEKTGPTTFTTWRRNFEPAKDLKILILSF